MMPVPFPSTDDNIEVVARDSSIRSHSLDPEMNQSAASSVNLQSHATTSSSKLTSSDKLSALPTSPAPSPNASRIARSTNFVMANIKRGYRHSLDSPSSLPVITAGDFGVHNHASRSTPREINLNRYNEIHPASIQRMHAIDHDSLGKETPRQRVSFDSDRSSLPTMRSVAQAFSRVTTRGSDPLASSPPLNSSSHPDHGDGEDSASDLQHLNSRSPSQSKSRAASPLRMFQNWSSNFHRGRTNSEERFVPIDPYKLNGRFPYCRITPRTHDIETGDGHSSSAAYDCEDLLPLNSIQDFFNDARIFLADTLPREIYLNFLLRLPSMYFCRVARIYEDADVSRPDIQRMIDNSGGIGSRHRSVSAPQPPSAHSPTPLATVGGMLAPGIASGIGLTAQVSAAPASSMMHMPLPFPDEWTPPMVSPALIRFKHSWEAFIDSLLREWKTLNVVSALLASAILTVFQIPEAADDPLTRTFALLSLICALMSLSYGCIYIVRFGTMRSMFHASRWAEEARKTNTSIWWNVWVLLATPAVWMAWAMLLFLSAILSFVWRTGSVNDPENIPPLSTRAALGPRIGITAVLLLGIIYLGMIINTLKKYGSHQHRGSAHSLTHGGGAGYRNDAEVGRTQTSPTSHKRKDRRRDHDLEMEHRGRERERSASVHVRRREEDPETRGRRWRESRDSERDSKKAVLKDVLGLKFTSLASSQRDVVERNNLELELDLKVPAEVNVSEIYSTGK